MTVHRLPVAACASPTWLATCYVSVDNTACLGWLLWHLVSYVAMNGGGRQSPAMQNRLATSFGQRTMWHTAAMAYVQGGKPCAMHPPPCRDEPNHNRTTQVCHQRAAEQGVGIHCCYGVAAHARHVSILAWEEMFIKAE